MTINDITIRDTYAWLNDPYNEYRCDSCPLNFTLRSPHPKIQLDQYWYPCGYQYCQVELV